ncbi:MAG: hypothetical protein WAW06_03955 [bacterium]
MALLTWHCRAVAAALVALAAFSLPAAAAEPPTVEARASATSMAVGDTIRLNLRLAWREGVQVKPPALPDKIGDFVVKDISEGAPVAVADLATRDVSVVLTTFEVGYRTIPPIPFVWVGQDGTAGKVESPPVEIEVKSILPGDAGDIRDIKRPLKVPKRWKDIILSYALVLGLAAGAAASILISVKRREDLEAALARAWRRLSAPVRRLILRLLALLRLRRRDAGVFDIRVDEPGLSASEAALKEIARIEALGLARRGMVGELYTLISETLRRYLERRYGVLAMESPTSFTMAALRAADLSADAFGLVESVLGESDLVKFAKYIPDEGPVASLIERAREVVRLTAAPPATAVSEQPAPERGQV